MNALELGNNAAEAAVVAPMSPRFEDYEIDPQALELRRSGSRVEVAPMAVRVLLYLVRHSDRMVQRKELYEQLWPEGGVDRERLLNTYIRQIRSALGERAGQNRYLRTYPRRGYRFVCEVHEGDRAARQVDQAVQSPQRLHWHRAAILLLGVLGAALWWSRDDTERNTPSSIQYELGEELLSDPSPSARASAAAHYRQALALDQDHVGALSGLAVSLFWAGDVGGAERAARAALALSPRDGRAHLALGSAVLQSEWAWADAERHLRAAVRTSRDDPEPRVALGFLLVAAGRSAEARQVLDEAVRLEPTAATVTGDLGLLYGWLGDAEAASVLCRRTIAVEPQASWGHECALRAAQALGDSTEVLARSASLVQLMGGDAEVVFSRASDLDTRLAALWRYVVDGAATTSRFQTAVAWAELGQTGAALDALEEAVHGREAGVPALAAVPAFRTLVGDPRYDELVREVLGS